MSGMLFDCAIDPFICAFEEKIVCTGEGEIGVCTDDVGAALAGFEVLPKMHDIFEQARHVAGLSLKPAKCVLVPTGVKLISSRQDHLLSSRRRRAPKVTTLPAAEAYAEVRFQQVELNPTLAPETFALGGPGDEAG